MKKFFSKLLKSLNPNSEKRNGNKVTKSKRSFVREKTKSYSRRNSISLEEQDEKSYPDTILYDKKKIASSKELRERFKQLKEWLELKYTSINYNLVDGYLFLIDEEFTSIKNNIGIKALNANRDYFDAKLCELVLKAYFNVSLSQCYAYCSSEYGNTDSRLSAIKIDIKRNRIVFWSNENNVESIMEKEEKDVQQQQQQREEEDQSYECVKASSLPNIYDILEESESNSHSICYSPSSCKTVLTSESLKSFRQTITES